MKRTSHPSGHVVREVHVPAAPGVVLIAIEGALDARAEATVDPLLDDLARHVRRGGLRAVVLDCAGVHHVTASGLRVLARHADALREAGAALTLVGCPPRVRVCLRMLGLGPLFGAVCARPPWR